jgi:hypothetical protein
VREAHRHRDEPEHGHDGQQPGHQTWARGARTRCGTTGSSR